MNFESPYVWIMALLLMQVPVTLWAYRTVAFLRTRLSQLEEWTEQLESALDDRFIEDAAAEEKKPAEPPKSEQYALITTDDAIKATVMAMELQGWSRAEQNAVVAYMQGPLYQAVKRTARELDPTGK